MLQMLALETRTFVLYESPHRIVKTLGELVEHLGPDRPIALFRELTKMHQEINRGPVGEIHTLYADRQSIRGEFVLVVGGAEVEKGRRKKWERKEDGEDGEEEGSEE